MDELEKCLLGICDGSGIVAGKSVEDDDEECPHVKEEREQARGEAQSDEERGN